MEERRDIKERMIKHTKKIKTAREYNSGAYYKNSQSLKNIKTKKTYNTSESESKIIQKFYPQTTTNKENKPIELEEAFHKNHGGRDVKKRLSKNKYSLKSYNYQANYGQTSHKTPTNRTAQNFNLKYPLVKKDQIKNHPKRISEFNTKSKSMLREDVKLKKNTKSVSSLTNKSLSIQKSKQKLSREKIKFRPEAKIGTNFNQSKPYIGKMIPPKTQREMQSFFNSSTQMTHNEDYS